MSSSGPPARQSTGLRSLTSLFFRTQVARAALTTSAIRRWFGKKAADPVDRAEAAKDFAAVAERLQELEASTALLLRSIAHLAVPPESLALPPAAHEPLVSVILPTWNRGDIAATAISSVQRQTYPHWELLVVDDGSTDGTRETIEAAFTDSRVHYIARDHAGVGAARNAGLTAARGEIVAYLDSDNTWLPTYLETIVAAFLRDDALQSVYTAQIVQNRHDGSVVLRGRDFDADRLRAGNYIDLNVYAHRRSLSDRCGGFDESLKRLVDWELIGRYTEHDKTQFIPVVGGTYTTGRADQISATQSREYSHYIVRSRRAPKPRPPLRVLYALWHYPQLSESYVRTEIDAVRRMGVDVEICAEECGAAPFECDTPIHYDGLPAAIDRFKPDVVHTHWLSYGETYGRQLQRSGLPLTVRGHGFEFSTELARRLGKLDRIAGVYVFPHFAEACRGLRTRVVAVPAAFNPDYYFPQRDKDRRLVLRTACALKTKELDTFMRVAQMCPSHRFVLVLARGHKVEGILDEMIEQNRAMGSPVEVRANVQREDLAALMRQAGIYLHTTGTIQPYGMPISIAEAMACGCHVVGKRRPGSAEYIGDAGSLYDTAEEAAALLQTTGAWTDRQWNDAFLRSVERAYRSYVSDTVIQPIVDDWRRIAGKAAM
jgi:glycosyltransferase involved in cell wall biosynthesis